MDFFLWACRSVHIVGMTAWLGGLIFQNIILTPFVNVESDEARTALKKVNKRFIGFIWGGVWSILITGILLISFDSHFIWFHYNDSRSILLGVKQLIFILMAVFAFGHARMLRYLESPSSNGGYDEKATMFRHRLRQYRTISIVLGIVAVFVAVGMRYSG